MSYAAWLTTTTPYEPSGLNSSVWSSSRRDSTVPAASVQRTPSGSTGTALGGTGAVPVTGHAQSSQLLTIRSAASGRSNLDSTTARGCACPMYHASSGRRCPGGSVKLLQTGEQHDGSAAAAPVRVEITEPVCLHRIGQESENLLERAELGGYRGGTGRADVPLGDVREPGPVVLQRLGQPRFGAGLLVVGDRQMSHDQPPPAVQVRERIVPQVTTWVRNGWPEEAGCSRSAGPCSLMTRSRRLAGSGTSSQPPAAHNAPSTSGWSTSTARSSRRAVLPVTGPITP